MARTTRKPAASRDESRREKLLAMVRSLPQATSTPYGKTHLVFRVRGKTFAYFLNNHHDDGRIALCTKAAPGRQQALVAADPERYFVPAYLGPHGWVSARLDLSRVDWDALLTLLVEAWRLQAPRTLSASL
ncbi:MAG: MmcQ/YjbR family DNA-binding protein [Phycisphaerales bacterium]|nr:MmcQ/YjbR family DNA-binding protein [Phycisphaerales bacterium]